MKYKKIIVVENVPEGTPLGFPYPYIDATSRDDAAAGRRIGVLGLLDDCDEIDEDDELEQGK